MLILFCNILSGLTEMLIQIIGGSRESDASQADEPTESTHNFVDDIDVDDDDDDEYEDGTDDDVLAADESHHSIEDDASALHSSSDDERINLTNESNGMLVQLRIVSNIFCGFPT